MKRKWNLLGSSKAKMLGNHERVPGIEVRLSSSVYIVEPNGQLTRLNRKRTRTRKKPGIHFTDKDFTKKKGTSL